MEMSVSMETCHTETPNLPSPNNPSSKWHADFRLPRCALDYFLNEETSHERPQSPPQRRFAHSLDEVVQPLPQERVHWTSICIM